MKGVKNGVIGESEGDDALVDELALVVKPISLGRVVHQIGLDSYHGVRKRGKDTVSKS